MKQKRKYKRIIFVAATALFTVLFWIALESYRELTKQEEIKKVDQLIAPLDPELNLTVLEEIEQRREYQLEQVEGYLLPEPTLAELSVAPTSEPTAFEESPAATGSGSSLELSPQGL